jgi:uncharacterized protein YjiS (DUF1127 family)
MHGTFEPASSAPLLTHPRGARWAAWLSLCLVRRRERQTLRMLNDDQLKDIGLSRADVERECRRWPWDGTRQREVIRSE